MVEKLFWLCAMCDAAAASEGKGAFDSGFLTLAGMPLWVIGFTLVFLIFGVSLIVTGLLKAFAHMGNN